MVFCTKCKEHKLERFFYKSKATKNGLQTQCIKCKKTYLNQNAEEIKQRIKEYQSARADKYKEYSKRYHNDNKDIVNAKRREYYKLNTDKKKEYQEINNDRIKTRRKEYYNKNRERLIKKSTKYTTNRRNSDPLYRFSCNIRTLIQKSFTRNQTKKYHKQSKTAELLGCTIPELRDHLERQFQPGMTWENHGFYGWHVDHRIPISSATTQEEVEKLCHYTNLQPLWAKENLEKSDKINIDTTR